MSNWRKHSSSYVQDSSEETGDNDSVEIGETDNSSSVNETSGNEEIDETQKSFETKTHQKSTRKYDAKSSKKNKYKRIVAPIDDSDTEEEEEKKFEMAILSPRTRRSINPAIGLGNNSDNSSDDFYDDDDDDNNDSLKNDQQKSKQIQSESDEDNEFEDFSKSILENQESKTQTTHNSTILTDNDVIEKLSESSKPLQTTEKQTSEQNISVESDDELQNSEHIQLKKVSNDKRSTMFQFNDSIRNKLSSTICEKTQTESKQNEINDDNIIEISSSSDNSFPEEIPPSPQVNKKQILQPKIITSLRTVVPPQAPNKEISVIDLSCPSTSKQHPYKQKSEQLVSKFFLEKELNTLSELKWQLETANNLYSSLASGLPDKGEKILKQINELKIKVKNHAEFCSNLVIDSNEDESTRKLKNSLESKHPTLDEMTAQANAVQPKFFGKQGIQTFTAEKAATLNCLKDIHGSLATCPTEDVLAEQPKLLKSTLMSHQRHALAWLIWREKQKPRGGILADDMGLGKTLTMISLVLTSIEHDLENENVSNSDSDDDDDNNGNWQGKGKMKTYLGGTLVICPASLIRQWEQEVEIHTKRNSLNVCVHHGNSREHKARRLAGYDIVITTYNVVMRSVKGVFSEVKWERIILDEAHVIRNHKSLTSEAVCELRSKSRWALTGTPIQNREVDLYSIIKFLRCSPFNELSHWKKWIDNKSVGGQQRLNALMKSLMLRRTKAQLQDKGALQGLPTKTLELIEVELDKNEMNVYQKVLIYSQALFAQFLQQRKENSDSPYAEQVKITKQQQEFYRQMHAKLFPKGTNVEVKSIEILLLLLRLRQICCHPGLIESMLTDDDDLNSSSRSDLHSQEIDLLEQLEKLEINDDSDNQEAIAKATSKVMHKSNPVFDLKRPSSKMKVILEYVEKKIIHTNDKGIIISQWVSVLNLIEGHLKRFRIGIASLNGSVPVDKRNGIVQDFNNPHSQTKVLLLSLTAGGVGLNLVGANHLFLIDLHWNPQLESQAADRIYRVGQTKPVFIYKFLCKNTIEERIKSIQDNKLSIAERVLTGAIEKNTGKLSIEELKCLFDLK